MIDVVVTRMSGQNEVFKKPGRVREVPLHGAGVGHRLDLAVFGGERLSEAFGQRAHGLKACS